MHIKTESPKRMSIGFTSACQSRHQRVNENHRARSVKSTELHVEHSFPVNFILRGISSQSLFLLTLRFYSTK